MRTRYKAILALGVLALLVLTARWLVAEPSVAPVAKPKPVPVRVVRVQQQDVTDYASGIGRVTSLHSVVIRTQIDGKLVGLHVKEGQWVKSGDLLATIDDRALRASLAEARAQLGQSRAQLKGAEIDLNRYRQLIAENGVSRQTFDQQQALFNQLKATVAGHEAAIAAAQVQLSHTRILSPVTGRVGIRNVDEGNFLLASDAQGLFTVTQMAPIAVEFSMPQSMLPRLQQLLEAPQAARVIAFNSDGALGEVSLGEGRLRLIDNQISATTGTLRAKAEFENNEQALWPGQLVNVKVQTALYSDVLTVPPKAVLRGLDNHFVYRLNGNVAEVQPVEVIHQSDELFIIEGVQAGDAIVSDGQSRLKPGIEVEPLGEGPASDQTAARQAQP
ncbi:RND transporter MFP subunit [Stutzerimonas stutzeri]|uniref:RND transporter MFP subunit n=1 Tax=Stutzerimonas stutzeri TaxID=316 RepID=W8R6G5_STUST|nr:efflux RND transporter periplasmic adaptor subunit [Stutzerimonas stutzeri]AHL73902.1 RND transporter MFP subunit [Stutzerimonas stutzeri]MCQ4328576.1 efflux RND transporter periplasmic adaptor subunit [Stutzerimonas stutzeri]